MIGLLERADEAAVAEDEYAEWYEELKFIHST